MKSRSAASTDPLKRLACVLLAAPLVLVGGACGGSLVEHELQAELQAQSESWRADFFKDQRELAGHWLYERRPGGGDASVVLATVAGWRDGWRSGGRASIAGKSGVPPALEANLKAWGMNWLDHVDDADLAGVDLRWMKDLGRFDHWDIEADGSPMNEVPWVWATAPIPDYITLQTAAKVRLLQGLRAAKGAEAAAEVRELARLAASTEILIGDAVGVSMIKLDVRARLMATKRGQDVSSWPASTLEEAERLRRMIFAAVGFFGALPLAPEVENDVVVGRCTALMEGGAKALLVRGLLNESHSERYASLTKSINESSCRLKNLRRAWNQASSDEQEIRDVSSITKGGPIEALTPLLFLPLVNQASGALLASSLQSGAGQFYGEALSSPSGVN